jgi:hypothetical protein
LQIITGESGVRRAEDIGGQELSCAEVKAIASGNPAVLTLAEADAELQRLNVLKKNHADEQYLARRNLRQLPDTIASLSLRMAALTADKDTATAHAADPITIGNRATSREDATDLLGERLKSVPDYARELKRVPLGVYRGLRFGLVSSEHAGRALHLPASVRHTTGDGTDARKAPDLGIRFRSRSPRGGKRLRAGRGSRS